MRVFWALSLIVSAPFNAAFAGQVKFTKIDVPGAAGVTTPPGINPQSNIVGTYFTFSNQTDITRGFLLSRGIFYNIDVVLAGAIPGSTNVMGINPRGDIVGSYTETNQAFVGFLLSKGTFSTIEVPGSTFSPATGISPQGDILGFYFDSRGIGHGYLLSKGIFTTIDVPGVWREVRLRVRSTREATLWEPTQTRAVSGMAFC